MSLFKISKSSNKAAGASKPLSSAQSSPRSSLSLDGPSAPAQNKSTSSADYYKTSSMAYAISR
ncbi:hypothetical protein BGZ82_004684, partial [Podila clonocystis]